MVSRPSPAASRSTLATRSRSASEARRFRGSGTAGELLISAKRRRTRARRYSTALGVTGTYCRDSPLVTRTRELPFCLGQHPRDVPAEADVARVGDAAGPGAGDELGGGWGQRRDRGGE